MKAQNLTISIPYKGCNKNCKYCVSRMTGWVKTDLDAMKRNAPKVLSLARAAQVNSVLLTGKGEPFMDFHSVLYFTEMFKEFPVEVQTNGIWLREHIFGKKDETEADQNMWPEVYGSSDGHSRYMALLRISGMNVVAFSVDDDGLPDFSKMVKAIHGLGMVVRVTFNITNFFRTSTFNSLVSKCKGWDVDQMTLRNICIPNNTLETVETDWIRKNVDPGLYERLRDDMRVSCEKYGFLIRTLPYGAKVYDFNGLAVSFSDYCIQDSNSGEDIRSLIFLEDGGLYTSWNSKASRLF